MIALYHRVRLRIAAHLIVLGLRVLGDCRVRRVILWTFDELYKEHLRK